MTDKQNQKAESGSTAIQAVGDVNYYNGVSASEIKEIARALASEFLPSVIAESRQTVDRRASEFEERIIQRIFKEKSGNAEAFKDPDFLSALQNGQESFVKTASNVKHKMLVDLVIRRSNLGSDNRRAYLLNEAIRKAEHISQEEIALLSILFTEII